MAWLSLVRGVTINVSRKAVNADMIGNTYCKHPEKYIEKLSTYEYFRNIMRILYHNPSLKAVDLARIADVRRNKIYDMVDSICIVGFAVQKKVGKYRIYSITPEGAEYWRYLSSKSDGIAI